MTKSPTFVDTTLAPSPRVLWYRTTLIKVGGEWQAAEFCADLEHKDDFESGMARINISDVLILAHDRVADLAALGISEMVPGTSGGRAWRDAVPAAAGEAEALGEDRPELDEPFSVLVDGVALNSSFPLATIRDACTSLGLGRRSGKMKCS